MLKLIKIWKGSKIMAGDLEVIYHRFNPNKAIQNSDLENYYVEIDQNETNIEELKTVLLQKIWLFYKTSEKHHKWDIYMP